MNKYYLVLFMTFNVFYAEIALFIYHFMVLVKFSGWHIEQAPPKRLCAVSYLMDSMPSAELREKKRSFFFHFFFCTIAGSGEVKTS